MIDLNIVGLNFRRLNTLIYLAKFKFLTTKSIKAKYLVMILNATRKFSTEDRTNKFKQLRQEIFCFRQGG